jgi:uncharacterized membrane protein YeaQ/YmgE (transglycosylase-associated protein family)
MVRSVLGVVVGVVLWAVGFYVLASVLAQVWPDYAVHARQWMRQGVYTFTTPMACCNQVFWILAEILAGWAAGKIAKRREAVWVLAALLGIYFAVLHFVILWTRFPWWYNFGVVIPAVPAVLLGGKLANALRASALESRS